MHGDFAGFISGNDLTYQKSVAHVFAVVFDGVGEVESLHPLDDVSGEGAFGVEIVHGLVGLFAG